VRENERERTRQREQEREREKETQRGQEKIFLAKEQLKNVQNFFLG
jgi:hypothetical protein